MGKDLIKNGYIPLDKSWMIRMGTLDAIYGYEDTTLFLKRQSLLSDDLQALYCACRLWRTNEPIDVGESATLFRFLRFAAWKFGLDKKFILRGTLKKRRITDNPEIIHWPLADLLKLDNNTSQWASAAVLFGNKEIIDNPPYKLKLTYKAVNHWREQRAKSQSWLPRYDQTILRQAETFLKILYGESVEFKPEQAEDYCFVRAFGFISATEGESRWPSLRGHESDRIRGMEKALNDFAANKEIISNDHRIIQAIVMKAKIENKNVLIKYPSAINKSWPQFWDFLKDAEKNSRNELMI